MELRVLALVLMGMVGRKDPEEKKDENNNDNDEGAKKNNRRSMMTCVPLPNRGSKYYKVMTHHLFPHLQVLIGDNDGEVRRAAGETIVKLALRVDPADVVDLILAVPLKLAREGQKKPSSSQGNGGGGANKTASSGTTTPEDLLITASNLLADLSSFLPPTRLSPEACGRYISSTLLALAEDANFRVRRSAVQALPRALSSASVEEVKKRLLPKFASLSGDEMYRVRKASGECLVDVSRALAMLGWRVHFNEVWKDDTNTPTTTEAYYKLRTKSQIATLSKTLAECHEIRRRVL